MVMNQKQNKAQSLPLNTIVIALLVIIVLVVIVVFFTTRTADAGTTITNTNDDFRGCKIGTFVLPEDQYTSARITAKTTGCSEGEKRISTASVPDGQVCCATPVTSS
ncbi:hypothetical protein H6501_03965 [Candidatus Woesearchaeota archaeon]|nr:hypothetical protein [Candidatus Woesearchaeota archaeon]USN43804.1 MAG: hypothetical protein H6500_05440 [Candidatus Woesearchaeota archaeon]